MDFLAALGVFATSALFGLLKSYTSTLDGRLGRAVKPFQPAVIAVAGVGLPYLTAALGITSVDPSVFVTAPTATILAITLREATRRLQGR